jgi:hypothetical protein
MQITFRLTQNELKKARRTAFLRFRSRTERYASYFFAVSSIVLIGLGMLFLCYGRTRAAEQLLALSPVVTAGIGFARTRTFASEPDYTEKQRFDVQEYGIFRLPFVGTQMKVPWTKISRYVETKDFFLLLSPWPWGAEAEPKVSWSTAWRLKPVLLVLPKRVFPPEDIVRFRILTQQRLSVWARNPNLQPISLHS